MNKPSAEHRILDIRTGKRASLAALIAALSVCLISCAGQTQDAPLATDRNNQTSAEPSAQHTPASSEHSLDETKVPSEINTSDPGQSTDVALPAPIDENSGLSAQDAYSGGPEQFVEDEIQDAEAYKPTRNRVEEEMPEVPSGTEDQVVCPAGALRIWVEKAEFSNGYSYMPSKKIDPSSDYQHWDVHLVGKVRNESSVDVYIGTIFGPRFEALDGAGKPVAEWLSEYVFDDPAVGNPRAGEITLQPGQMATFEFREAESLVGTSVLEAAKSVYVGGYDEIDDTYGDEVGTACDFDLKPDEVFERGVPIKQQN